MRREMKLTQHQFAQRLGTTFVSVCRWEKGKSRPQERFVIRIYELSRNFMQAKIQRKPGEAPIDFSV
jgi:transcriptional regulator with XRE-family HTH domain